MKKNQDDEVLLNKIKTGLEDGVNDIDSATETRLRMIRQEAVSQIGKRTFNNSWQWGGAIAATVLVAIFSMNLQQNNISGGKFETIAALEDMKLLSASDDLEMYQDLEFYEDLESIRQLDDTKKTS